MLGPSGAHGTRVDGALHGDRLSNLVGHRANAACQAPSSQAWEQEREGSEQEQEVSVLTRP